MNICAPAMCQLFAVYIVLRKCVYEAAGCNTSACVYVYEAIIVFVCVMIV